jgi:hypothetical protein
MTWMPTGGNLVNHPRCCAPHRLEDHQAAAGAQVVGTMRAGRDTDREELPPARHGLNVVWHDRDCGGVDAPRGEIDRADAGAALVCGENRASASNGGAR